MQNGLMGHPRRLGIVAATLATGAGLAFMAAAGAPRTYLVIDVAATRRAAAGGSSLPPGSACSRLRNSARPSKVWRVGSASAA